MLIGTLGWISIIEFYLRMRNLVEKLPQSEMTLHNYKMSTMIMEVMILGWIVVTIAFLVILICRLVSYVNINNNLKKARELTCPTKTGQL